MISAVDNLEFSKILDARHHDPFSWLGLHATPAGFVFRTFLPQALEVSLKTADDHWEPLKKTDTNGLFEWQGNTAPATPCLLKITNFAHHEWQQHDPYSCPTLTSEHDLYLFSGGNLKQAYKTLGAHLEQYKGISGVRFCVWAPNAERVSVVGDFNQWDGRIHPMRAHGASGVWDIFIPGLASGDIYKFEIRNRDSGLALVKADPYAFGFESLPGTASRITALQAHAWQDGAWMQQRQQSNWMQAPFNCYEVHLGAWRRNPHGQFLSYRELTEQLIDYVVYMGYTHIELLPITEHPLNESWGYQTTGYFAATHRFGNPDDLRYLIDKCHQANIGVILDWVPGHFPKDDWALARFDGTPLYEHADPRRGEHQDWGTYIFNYGRNEVRNFLLANAWFWLSEFHIDGLRVDAVASMLYLDYSRKEGEWLPNEFGGRENIEAIDFLKQLNIMVHQDFPGALTIAEESTAWPMVSRPVYMGGLGFSMKWNMGWMNDTLSYMELDPIHRRYHQNKLTFGQLYAYSENFILPFSHDEVVHGKHSLLDKMPGDTWQKFANLRLLMTYQMTMPGKKLNFMGNELAQGREWNVNTALDWHLLDIPWHSGVHLAVRDLNHLYKTTLALHEQDFEQQGFQWIDCEDAAQSIISFIRRAQSGAFIITVLNFTPVLRSVYRLGVPEAGKYIELFNSDARCYGGSNQGNGAGLNSEAIPWMGYNQSVNMSIPPLGGVILTLTE